MAPPLTTRRHTKYVFFLTNRIGWTAKNTVCSIYLEVRAFIVDLGFDQWCLLDKHEAIETAGVFFPFTSNYCSPTYKLLLFLIIILIILPTFFSPTTYKVFQACEKQHFHTSEEMDLVHNSCPDIRRLFCLLYCLLVCGSMHFCLFVCVYFVW